jgi:hypothetical protein
MYDNDGERVDALLVSHQNTSYTLIMYDCSHTQNLRVAQHRDLQTETIFVAQNGLVVMEAESMPVVAPWKLESSIPGYNGTGYFRFDGNTVSSGSPLGMLSYKFQIDVPGTYTMRMRVRKNATTTSNDCYTKMVGYEGFRGEPVRSFIGGLVKPNVWATRLEHIYGDPRVIETPTYTLPKAGVYELQVFGRTKHFILDRIMLYHTGLVTDTLGRDPTRPESPRLGAGPVPVVTKAPVAPVPATTKAPVAPVVVRSPTMAPVTAKPVSHAPVVAPQLPKIILNLVTARLAVDEVIQELVGGDVVSRAVVGTYISIAATCPEVPNISKITFYYASTIGHVETAAPYLMQGNTGTKNTPVNYLKTTGAKQVSVKVYDSAGLVRAERILDFTIVD